ncbi:hypothetical protein BCR33DRAFT_389760 [Rhizoclosmatium globosum]|uniref:Transmembrane protein n=1 Tax=Rhizoclosmatium globosum TaxID=329046 RepID=A0A1Y2BZL5_9FUNG|nr:hypothetical protein BCR33DRAFT_389760 [Rhizoclosmatium globosum]|eukprot:ORY39505.1 hypothetical protein BCR33DRAFT_389760 [Rhizoclosmatium globosum]
MDAAKYSYIMYKALAMAGFPQHWPYLLTGIISLILYWLYMEQSYTFQLDCQAERKGNWALILLYGYWTIVDFSATIVMLLKMNDFIHSNNQISSASLHSVAVNDRLEDEVKVFSFHRIREEVRLCLTIGGMGAISAVSVLRVARPELGIPVVSRIVFVFSQLLLLTGSRKVAAVDVPSIRRGSLRRGSAIRSNSMHSTHSPVSVTSSLIGPMSRNASQKSSQSIQSISNFQATEIFSGDLNTSSGILRMDSVVGRGPPNAIDLLRASDSGRIIGIRDSNATESSAVRQSMIAKVKRTMSLHTDTGDKGATPAHQLLSDNGYMAPANRRLSRHPSRSYMPNMSGDDILLPNRIVSRKTSLHNSIHNAHTAGISGSDLVHPAVSQDNSFIGLQTMLPSISRQLSQDTADMVSPSCITVPPRYQKDQFIGKESRIIITSPDD